jgi:hypothetical protein
MASAYPARLASLAQEAALKLKRSREYLTSASILLLNHHPAPSAVRASGA